MEFQNRHDEISSTFIYIEADVLMYKMENEMVCCRRYLLRDGIRYALIFQIIKSRSCA